MNLEDNIISLRIKQLIINFLIEKKIFKIPILYSEYLSYRYGNWNTVVQDYDYFNDDKSLHKV